MASSIPKDPAFRQRRNRVATSAVLTLKQPERRRVPRLPQGHVWHALTRSWWRDVWASPMAAEYLESDRHGLYILASLVDRYWTAPTVALASEIRLQRQCFGLTPIDRRRLQWEVERVESVTRRRPHRSEPGGAAAEDPLAALRLVK